MPGASERWPQASPGHGCSCGQADLCCPEAREAMQTALVELQRESAKVKTQAGLGGRPRKPSSGAWQHRTAAALQRRSGDLCDNGMHCANAVVEIGMKLQGFLLELASGHWLAVWGQSLSFSPPVCLVCLVPCLWLSQCWLWSQLHDTKPETLFFAGFYCRSPHRTMMQPKRTEDCCLLGSSCRRALQGRAPS